MKYVGLAIVLCLFLHPNSSIAQLNKQKPRNLKDVGITEHLGDTIPLDLKFANAEGDSIQLKDLFKDDKPVLLNPVYYECPQLCSMVKEGIFKGIKGLNWSPGKDYNIVTFSIDPTEGPDLAMQDKKKYLTKLGRQGVDKGWHFLTGTEANIEPLVKAIGYNFKKLKNGQYAHGTAIMFLSPKGKITRYLYGIDFKPFDVKNALYEAADGNIGTTTEQVLLYCYCYSPSSNSYVAVGWRIMQIGGTATMLLLGMFLGFMWIRHRYTNNDKKIEDTNERA